MTALVILGVVAFAAIVSVAVTNLFWLRHLKYLTNLAVSRTPVEFATMQAASRPPTPEGEKPKRIRPEGI